MNIALGLGLVLFAAGLLLVFTFRRGKSKASFRAIPAFTRLQRALSLSIEDGTRLHISLGRGGMQTPRGASALAGLGMLRHIAENTAVSDKPTIATSGDAVLAILTRDTLKDSYKAAVVEDLYNPSNGRLTGLTPFSYAVGTIPAMRDENVSANVFLGNFSAEIALLTDTAERTKTFTTAAADNPSAQAIIYATTDSPLIGEELFAASAYIGGKPSHQASLQVQDILRWALILIILGGSALKLVGVL